MGQGGAVTFKDVTAGAGITFIHNSGRSGKKYLPETMGAGGAFVDLDGDGWLDLVIVNGRDWTPKAGHGVGPRALPQQSQRHVHRRRQGQRSRPAGVRAGRGGRRCRQRRRRRPLHHGARRRSAVSQRRRLQVHQRHQGRRHRQRQLRHQRGVCGLRPRRPARRVRRQLREVVRGHRQALRARRQEQVVLHARGLSRAWRRSCFAIWGRAASPT